jgi:hypothetical protein
MLGEMRELEGWVLVKSHGIKKDKNSEKNI